MCGKIYYRKMSVLCWIPSQWHLVHAWLIEATQLSSSLLSANCTCVLMYNIQVQINVVFILIHGDMRQAATSSAAGKGSYSSRSGNEQLLIHISEHRGIWVDTIYN